MLMQLMIKKNILYVKISALAKMTFKNNYFKIKKLPGHKKNIIILTN